MNEQTEQPGPEHAPRLRMEGVRKRFGATLALGGVDLAVRAGEVHALVGENGAGKSTLMKILAGAQPPDEGRMWLDGEPYRPRNPLEARRAGVAMIYQELSLASHLSAEENILLGMEPRRGGVIRRGEQRRLASEALRQLGHAGIDPARTIDRLSIAQRQIVEIARAVAVGCRVLVLDEPTSSLNRSDIEQLFELVRRLRAQGHAIVYISHFLEEVTEISDRYTVLRDGRTVGSGATAETDGDELASMMVGRSVDQMYVRGDRRRGEPLLSFEGLSGRTKPTDASLTLHRGEVVGIAGLVGAGRTELVRSLFGLDPIRSGRVKLGTYEGPATPRQRWKQGAGMVSEDRKEEGLAVPMTLADNVTLSRMKPLGPLGTVLPRRQAAHVQRWIDKLDIRCHGPEQRVADLSGGNQQKVALARLLHHGVDLWLLDEPTRGIDVGSKAQVYQLIDELVRGDPSAGRPPRAVLLVSSYLPELLGVCDRIAVMHRGRLGQARPVDQWDKHTLMLEATGQEAAA